MFKRLNGLSLFAKVGIAETYLYKYNINICVANEIDSERAKFYKELYPSCNMICGDITDDIVFNKVMEESKKNKIDFIIATPPCQGMSTAGKKDPDDIRNNLIFYAIKAIKILKPKFVILENVTMQNHTRITYNNKKVLIPDYIYNELGNEYNFNNNRIVNAMDYGVPQSRIRNIYLMSSKNMDLHWEFPEKNEKIITIKDAIGNLPSLDPFLRDENERWHFPDFEKKKEIGLKISKWHYPPTHSWKQVEWMIHTPSGASAFKNNIYFPKKDNRRIKGAPRTYMRMDWDKPATTILQNSGVISTFSTVHPGRKLQDDGTEMGRVYSDPRALTIYELLILTSLPTDWNIPDWASDTFIRKVIGEGIPPKLIESAIKSLQDLI